MLSILSRVEVLAYFGDPSGYIKSDGSVSEAWPDRILTAIALPQPLRTSWDQTKRITHLRCHRRIAPMLEGAFSELHKDPVVWSTINDCGGCYEFRRIGGKKELSNHSWGIAVDLDVLDNPMFAMIPRVHARTKAIMQAYGFVWGGATIWGGAFPWGRRDSMHWEFANVSILSA